MSTSTPPPSGSEMPVRSTDLSARTRPQLPKRPPQTFRWVSTAIIGAIVVERVFGLNGIGAFFIEAIRFRDFIGMQAVLMLFVVFFVTVNLLVDLCAMSADPRLRRPRRA